MVTRMGWKRFFGRLALVCGSLGLFVTACSSDDAGGNTGEDGGNDSGGGTAGTGTGGTSGTSGASGTAGSTGGTGGTTSDPALRTFCDRVRDEQVDFLARCSGLATELARAFVSIDPCAAWEPAVAGGRMQFDAAADAGACIAAMRAMSCDADALPAACDAVLWGLRADGESCGFTAETTGFSECGAGSACVGALFGAAACEGTCVKRGLIGQACSGERPCALGYTCTVNGGCAPKGSAGTPCGLTSSPECAEGLYCSDLTSGTCTARKPTGASCSGQLGECAPPNVCDRGASLTGTCEVPKKPGDACVVDDFECGTGFSYCGSDMTCHALATIGEPCTTEDGEGTYCLLGTCDETLPTPVCKTSGVGEPCTHTAECPTGSLCVPGFQQVCSPLCF
jgi:hypothetical protein